MRISPDSPLSPLPPSSALPLVTLPTPAGADTVADCQQACSPRRYAVGRFGEETPPDDTDTTPPPTQPPATTPTTVPAASPAASQGSPADDTPAADTPIAPVGDTPAFDSAGSAGKPAAPVTSGPPTPEVVPLLPATGYASLPLLHNGAALLLIGLAMLALAGRPRLRRTPG